MVNFPIHLSGWFMLKHIDDQYCSVFTGDQFNGIIKQNACL